ncbi:MAG: carboxypeptidase-like regulatory domain-containing protein [Thiolinea sp.]
MGKGLKLLLAGALFGVMAVFAVIGVKSILGDKQTAPAETMTQSEFLEAQQPIGLVPPENTDGSETDGSQTLADQPEQQAEPDTQLTPDAAQQAENKTESTQPNDSNNEQADQQVATPSTNEQNQLDMQLIDEYGGLQLTLSDPANPGQPTRGQFVIRDIQDQVVASMQDTDTASFDLSPGIYEVTVIAKGKKNARMVQIVTGEFVTENFTLPADAPAQTNAQGTPAQTTADAGNTQQQQAAPNQPAPAAGKGSLSVQVQTAGSAVPLKANVYVQLPNGQNVTKQNYVDSAGFELPPGTYKVTVKAPGKVDMVRNIQIQAGGRAQEVFALQSPAAQAENKPPAPVEGTLRLLLRSPGNNQRGRFVITDEAGQRVNRMRGVSNAEVKLKPGSMTWRPCITVHG